MDEAERTRAIKILNDFIELREKHPYFVRSYLLDYADCEDYEFRKKKSGDEGFEFQSLEIARSLREAGSMTDEQIAEIVGLSAHIIRKL